MVRDMFPSAHIDTRHRRSAGQPQPLFSLRGTVIDEDSAAIPGAIVRVKDQLTGDIVALTVADESGNWFADALGMGAYEVDARFGAWNATSTAIVQPAAAGTVLLKLQTEGIPANITSSTADGSWRPQWDTRFANYVRPAGPRLVWNAWADAETGEQYEAVPFLSPRQDFVVTLDLASTGYALSGERTPSVEVSNEFQKNVAQWAQTATDTITLKVKFLADQNIFNVHQDDSLDELKIDISKARAVPPNPPTMEELRDVGSGLGPYTLGRVRAHITTGNNPGWGYLTATMWAKGRPIEQVTVKLCVSNSLAESKTDCPSGTSSRMTTGFIGIDTLKAVSEDVRGVDVGIMLIAQSPENVFGVMSTVEPEAFVSWELVGGQERIVAFLEASMRFILDHATTDKALERYGDDLFRVLVPPIPAGRPEAPDNEKARRLFEQLFVESDQRKSVSFRSQKDLLPIFFPIGLTRVKQKFIGDVANVQMPLPVEIYGRHEGCLDKWALVTPPPTGIDTALRIIRTRGSRMVTKWKDMVALHHTDLEKFGEWLSGKDEPNGAALFLVGHHNHEDAFFFDPNKPLSAASIGKSFTTPSVAFLNGCGVTGTPGMGWITQLNYQGVSTIVATVGDVEAEMAADFMNCVDEVLADNAGMSVATLYGKSLDCLDAPISKWGPRRHKFLLLGDGDVQVCRPTKPLPQTQ